MTPNKSLLVVTGEMPPSALLGLCATVLHITTARIKKDLSDGKCYKVGLTVLTSHC